MLGGTIRWVGDVGRYYKVGGGCWVGGSIRWVGHVGRYYKVGGGCWEVL